MAASDFQVTPSMVASVVEWHERQPDDRIRRPLVPHLKEKFGISNAEAIAVLRATPGPDERDDLKARIVSALLNGGGLDAA